MYYCQIHNQCYYCAFLNVFAMGIMIGVVMFRWFVSVAIILLFLFHGVDMIIQYFFVFLRLLLCVWLLMCGVCCLRRRNVSAAQWSTASV